MIRTKLKLAVSEDLQGLRLDIFCSRRISDHTRSYFTRLASSGHITADGKTARPSLKVKKGMQVEIELIARPPMDARPEDIPLDIIYEDDRIAVVNKSAGMVVHPAAGNYEGTLVNALMHHFGETVGEQCDSARPGLVHRLDKDTSGLLVIAKDERGLAFLQQELKERRIKRHYKALCWGNLEPDRGTIDLPIGRSDRDRKKMVVFPRIGRDATTHYEVLDRLGLANLVLLKLETGRTHQIRVHLSHYGHPVIGDPTYGGRSKYVKRLQVTNRQVAAHLLSILSRQALHAFRLEFPHPDDGRMVDFESELPEDIFEVLEYLRSEK